MSSDARERFAADVRARLDAEPLRRRAEIARQAHVSRTHLHRIEHGERWPSHGVAAALDDTLGADGELRALWHASEQEHTARSGRAREHLWAPVEAITDDPDTVDRVRMAADCPRRADSATVAAVAEALAVTRRLEDLVGSAAVLPTVRTQLELAERLVTGARSDVRRDLAAVAGEMHQYTGWLFSEIGDTANAHNHLNAALATGIEIDDPNLASVAVSFKGHVAWNLGDATSVIDLSRAAARDQRVFVAQHAFNAFQEARGHGMTGDPVGVGDATDRAVELAGTAIDERHNAPAGQYWYGPAFFKIQCGLAWQSLRDPSFAAEAAEAISAGIAELSDSEADSEWAVTFTVREAQAHVDAGNVDQATDAALRAARAAVTFGSPTLTRAVHDLHAEISSRYPGARDARELDGMLSELPDRRRNEAGMGFDRR